MIQVSVVVPVYNVAPYVEACARSLMGQTCRDIEVFLVDDGSPDNAGEICDRVAREDDRIHVIHQRNQGVSVARNTGMAQAKGKWVCFVDGDDYLPADAIEKLLQKAEETDCDIVIGDYHVVRENKPPEETAFILDKQDERFTFDELIENCMLGNLREDNVTCIGVPWAKLYRRTFLEEKHLTYLPGLKRNQDVLFNLYCFAATDRIVYCRAPVCDYRVWENSAVNKYSPNYIDTANRILQEFEKFFRLHDPQNRLREFYERRAMFMYYECLRLQLFHPQRKDSPLKRWPEYRALVQSPYLSLGTRPKALLSRSQKLLAWLNGHGLTPLSYLLVCGKNFKR